MTPDAVVCSAALLDTDQRFAVGPVENVDPPGAAGLGFGPRGGDDAGLAGSSGISVGDFQTHPHDPWVLAPIEHAGKIRSRIASETTYGRSAEATASRTWAPAETPEASTVYKMPWWGMLIPGSAAAPQPPELRAALAPSFQPEPGDPLQGLRLTKDRHAQIDAGFEHIGRTEFCRNAVCPPVVRVVEVMLKLAILDVADFYSVLTNHTGCDSPRGCGARGSRAWFFRGSCGPWISSRYHTPLYILLSL